MHLAGGAVHLDGPGFTAQEFVHRLVLALADDVPAGGFDPEIAPPQNTGLSEQILNGLDIRRIRSQQVPADQIAQPLPFKPEGSARRIAFNPVIRNQFDKRETVVRLGIAGNPSGARTSAPMEPVRDKVRWLKFS